MEREPLYIGRGQSVPLKCVFERRQRVTEDVLMIHRIEFDLFEHVFQVGRLQNENAVALQQGFDP